MHILPSSAASSTFVQGHSGTVTGNHGCIGKRHQTLLSDFRDTIHEYNLKWKLVHIQTFWNIDATPVQIRLLQYFTNQKPISTGDLVDAWNSRMTYSINSIRLCYSLLHKVIFNEINTLQPTHNFVKDFFLSWSLGFGLVATCVGWRSRPASSAACLSGPRAARSSDSSTSSPTSLEFSLPSSCSSRGGKIQPQIQHGFLSKGF